MNKSGRFGSRVKIGKAQGVFMCGYACVRVLMYAECKHRAWVRVLRFGVLGWCCYACRTYLNHNTASVPLSHISLSFHPPSAFLFFTFDKEMAQQKDNSKHLDLQSLLTLLRQNIQKEELLHNLTFFPFRVMGLKGDCRYLCLQLLLLYIQGDDLQLGTILSFPTLPTPINDRKDI